MVKGKEKANPRKEEIEAKKALLDGANSVAQLKVALKSVLGLE